MPISLDDRYPRPLQHPIETFEEFLEKLEQAESDQEKIALIDYMIGLLQLEKYNIQKP